MHSAHDRTCLGLHGQDFSSLSTRITHIAARHAAFSTRTMDQPWSAASRTQELIVRERPEPRGPATGGAAGGERHPHPRDGPVVSGAWFLRVETSRSLLLSCLFAVPLSLSSVLSTVRLKQEPVLNVQLDRSVSVELCNRSALVGDWDRIERGTFVRGAAHRRHAHHPHIEDDLCV